MLWCNSFNLKIIVPIIMLSSLAVLFFELHPIVTHGQAFVSLENYANKNVTCTALLNERPWYGKFNWWFFTWLVLVPTIIFGVQPQASPLLRAVRIILSIAFCYLLLNLAVNLQWQIRNAPFHHDPYHPDPVNGWRVDCFNNADGFSLIQARLFAWIPACVYTWLCIILWAQYHKQWSKKITGMFKQDIASQALSVGIKIYFIMILLFAASIILFDITSYFAGKPLFEKGWFGVLYFFIVRPLLIPIEIFYY